jgi:hypothetical protein
MTSTHMLYRTNSSDTSREAAESIDVTRMEAVVLFHIWNAGINGATQDELLAQLTPYYTYGSVTARPAALKRKGLVIDSGLRRPGASGRNQIVLIAAEFAK